MVRPGRHRARADRDARHDCSDGGLAVALAECAIGDRERLVGVAQLALDQLFDRRAVGFGQSREAHRRADLRRRQPGARPGGTGLAEAQRDRPGDVRDDHGPDGAIVAVGHRRRALQTQVHDQLAGARPEECPPEGDVAALDTQAQDEKQDGASSDPRHRGQGSAGTPVGEAGHGRERIVDAGRESPHRDLDELIDGEMKFDFTLREGIVTKSNGVELMRSVGLNV